MNNCNYVKYIKGRELSQSVSQSVRSWRRADYGTHETILICSQTITVLLVMGRPL